MDEPEERKVGLCEGDEAERCEEVVLWLWGCILCDWETYEVILCLDMLKRFLKCDVGELDFI